MNKLFVASVLFAAGLIFSLTSCDDDSVPYSAAPRYGKMVFDPAIATPGDSVTVTVEQTQKGVSLISTTYKWTFRYSYEAEPGVVKDTTEVISQHTNYDAMGQADPSVRFLVPDNCESRFVSVTLNATFSGYSGPTLFFQATKSGTLSVSY